MTNDAKRGPVVVAYVAHVAGWTVPQVPHGRLPAGALAPPQFPPQRNSPPLTKDRRSFANTGSELGDSFRGR